MKHFRCQCKNKLFFENEFCVKCGRSVGFLPDIQELSSLEPISSGLWLANLNGKTYKDCTNKTNYNVCNWLIPVDDPQTLCKSCRLNHVIPNLAENDNLSLWYRMEKAKRRLLFTLNKLQLPIVNLHLNNQKGLGFSFVANKLSSDEFGNELTVKETVMTGHSNGLITINLREANHHKRIKTREEFNEKYRTLLGHFRHESGHYYWDRLIANSQYLDEFRTLFGDERLDYRIALKNYYDNGPSPTWQNVWISAYASMHPWEDWAESWAHYLHMIDTLETANDVGFTETNLSQNYADDDNTPVDSFEKLFLTWCQLTSAVNSLNRSMGLDDIYPFIISMTAASKLSFIHKIIAEQAPN